MSKKKDIKISQNNNDNGRDKQEVLINTGVVLSSLGAAGFIACFVWLIVKATIIESTRLQKLLPVIIGVIFLLMCIVGILLIGFARHSMGAISDEYENKSKARPPKEPRLGEIPDLNEIYKEDEKDYIESDAVFQEKGVRDKLDQIKGQLQEIIEQKKIALRESEKQVQVDNGGVKLKTIDEDLLKDIDDFEISSTNTKEKIGKKKAKKVL